MKAALFLIVGVAAGQQCLTTDWGQWGACSVTCGGGQETRTRKIAVHPADGNLTSCDALTEEKACNTGVCEVRDCLYSLWSDWTPCTQECLGDDGVAGTQMRSRTKLREAKKWRSGVRLEHPRRDAHLRRLPLRADKLHARRLGQLGRV